MFGWGDNSKGQLGLVVPSRNVKKPTEVPFSRDLEISQIACGDKFTLILTKGGVIYSLGDNSSYQLGQDRVSASPQVLAALETQTVTNIQCGLRHSIALTRENELFAWGCNIKKQLAQNSINKTHVPKLVKFPSNAKIVQIACGGFHTAIVTDIGEVFVFGDNSEGQLGIGNQQVTVPTILPTLPGLPVKQLACGQAHTFVLTISGALFGFGRNSYGQLGLGNETNHLYPTQCKNLRDHKIVYVTCGGDHTAAVATDGGLFTWGLNDCGQLGHSSKANQSLPIKCVELMGATVIQVACGDKHTTVYIKNTNKILAFGRGTEGQLCSNLDFSRHPVEIEFDNRFHKIFSGGCQNFLLANDQPLEDMRAEESVLLLLDNNRLDQLKSYKIDDDVPTSFLEETKRAFGSLSTYNSSFLKGGGMHFNCSSKNNGLDLDACSDFWAGINDLQNQKLKQIIDSSISCNLIPVIKSLNNPPDVETLRIYLILPTSHLFSKTSKTTSVQVAYGTALTNLKPIPYKIVDKWWTALATRHFNKIIVAFKSSVVSLLQARNNDDVLVCLKTLAKAYNINLSTHKVPYEKFYISEVTNMVDIKRDYISWIRMPINGTEKVFSLCNYPFVFNPEAKWTLLRLDTQIQMMRIMEEIQRRNLFQPPGFRSDNPYFFLEVRRDHIIEDTLNRLASCAHECKKPLKVKFSGEEAIDEGGVQKEFFQLIISELLVSTYGMFSVNDHSRLLWFSDLTFEQKHMFSLIGMICGLAIYNSRIIDVPFPLALYKKLLGKPVNLDDFKELDPAIGNSLEQLLDYEDGDLAEVFYLNWAVNREEWGEMKTIPLCPNGENIPVTQENKKAYVEAYTNYIFNDSVKEQYNAFAEGFKRVAGGRVLELFEAEELRAGVSGNENYDWEILENTTQYKGVFWANHPTIQLFWKVFRSLSEEEKKAFLKFLTGSDRIPIHGMDKLKISIKPSIGDESHLPVAHTCFDELDLPLYQDENTMRKKLTTAIASNEGFGLM
ncbi:DgyrCDS5419 [Dimorphilus gyrociliatus]|uniref:DgyrCDS5419 n=1 Tax=Dimorphilus gyrociliatus TaxID=2664684 RepID=A0A7I8VPN0_9ANNE|nr:DgyrCDS5419 [Dimorphilus gyrociliatus]